MKLKKNQLKNNIINYPSQSTKLMIRVIRQRTHHIIQIKINYESSINPNIEG